MLQKRPAPDSRSPQHSPKRVCVSPTLTSPPRTPTTTTTTTSTSTSTSTSSTSTTSTPSSSTTTTTASPSSALSASPSALAGAVVARLVRTSKVSPSVPLPKVISLKKHRGPKERSIPSLGQAYGVTAISGCLLFGRDPEMVDVTLDSTRFPNLVSRVHAAVYHGQATDGTSGWWIEDRNSTNGVFVNDLKVKHARLHEGDVITFGGVHATALPVGGRLVQPLSEFVYTFQNYSPGTLTAASPSDTVAAAAAAAAAARLQVEQELKQQFAREKEQSDAEKEQLLRELQRQLEHERAGRQRDEEEREAMRARVRELQEEAERQQAEALAELQRKQHEAERKIQELAAKSEAANNAEIQQLREQCDRWKKEAEGASGLASNLEAEFDCVICSELITCAMTLPCSHSFCSDCIETWLKRSNSCPQCRTPLAPGAKAVPSIALDNAIEKMAPRLLSAEELEERKERIAAWHQQRRAQATAPAPTAAGAAAISLVSDDDDDEEEDDDDDDDDDEEDDDDDDDDGEDIDDEEEEDIGFERAPSGRARCRLCGSLINNGALRVSRTVHNRVSYYTNTYYYHANCWCAQSSKPLQEYTGWGRLSAMEQVTLSSLASRRRR